VSVGSSAGLDDVAGAEPDSIDPPLLLIVTPGATWDVDPVAPDVCVVSVDAEVPVEGEPVLVDADPDEPTEAAVSLVVVLVFAASALVPVLPPVDVPVDVEVEPVVSALATPGEVMTITPMPKAAANAPTRPT
jgi:hypothetical protein